MSGIGANSPLSSDNLNDQAAWPFWDEVDEVVVRISRYENDMVTPACFQAIARGRDRSLSWGVGVGPCPVAALQRAIATFFDPKSDGTIEDAKRVHATGMEHNIQISKAEAAARSKKAVKDNITRAAESARTEQEPPPLPDVEDLLG